MVPRKEIFPIRQNFAESCRAARGIKISPLDFLNFVTYNKINTYHVSMQSIYLREPDGSRATRMFVKE